MLLHAKRKNARENTLHLNSAVYRANPKSNQVDLCKASPWLSGGFDNYMENSSEIIGELNGAQLGRAMSEQVLHGNVSYSWELVRGQVSLDQNILTTGCRLT